MNFCSEKKGLQIEITDNYRSRLQGINALLVNYLKASRIFEWYENKERYNNKKSILPCKYPLFIMMI